MNITLVMWSASCARWSSAPAAGPDVTTEGFALTGRRLERPRLDSATQTRLTAQLIAASDTLRRQPSADALIWVGRRLAYLGRHREAIDTFSVGATRYPTDARFLRHRGHRYLTVRRPALAAQDLAKAATLVRGQRDVIEPDGAPNPRNIPVSTLQFNIWYHLALAHYVQGEHTQALAAWDSCARVSVNPDLMTATQYWRWLTLKALRRDADAAAALAIARENPDVIENGAYLKLLRLFAGLEPASAFASNLIDATVTSSNASDATTAYGVSMWHWYGGRAREARALWAALDQSAAWGSFAVLAAEGEITRRR